MKFRIIKKEGHKFPYQIQYRFMLWWVILLDKDQYGVPMECWYKTQSEAEKHLSDYLKSKMPPEVIKEVKV